MQRQTVQLPMDVEEANEENCKKIGDNVGPTDSLMGSITTSTLDREEKELQIRSSARVFKKMKLEQEQDNKKNEENIHPDISLTSPNPEQSSSIPNTDKVIETGAPLRCNTRVIKKAKQEPILEQKGGKKEEPKTDLKIRKWGYEYKAIFFDAVNQYGKDFENIQQYINSKLKKKGASDEHMRSKKHARWFFIRTFQKVSKHVKFSDNVKKVVQELYGVINYGELYKKLRTITEKTCLQLSELIYHGETCIRIKGKMHRIKTPMCRALIKLNQLDLKYEELKLPNRVTVELRPKDMQSYLNVQHLAQNPRLRTTLPIQKRLSSLIQCLNKRWRTVEAVSYEKLVQSNNPITNDYVPSKQVADQNMEILMLPLRLRPPADAKIELPSINLGEYLTRQTICLTAYESRLDEIKRSKMKKTKPEATATTSELNHTDPICDSALPAKHSSLEGCELLRTFKTEEPDALLANAVHEAVNTILSLQTFDRQLSETEDGGKIESIPLQETELPPPQPPPPPPVMSQEDLDRIEKIRKGWTELTSESLTIGEIYLMYGSDGKLILEYSWEGDVKKDELKSEKSAANFLEMWNDSYEESFKIRQRSLTSSLSKLLSLAHLHYRQNIVKCPCGHVCNERTLPAKRNSLYDNNTSLKTETDSIVLAVVPDVPNGTPPVRNSAMFRAPILPKGPVVQSPSMQQQLNSIQKLKPKFCNRKGRRPRQKPIVVERKLPLLPNNLSGHQIVRMSIISREPAATVAAAPETPEVTTTSHTILTTPTPFLSQDDVNMHSVMTDPDDDNSVISTVPSSPSRILKEGDSSEWINADCDYSLSSLLGHLENPMKTSVSLGGPLHSELSDEVDAQLESLMSESTIDFAASFADLAASVGNDKKF